GYKLFTSGLIPSVRRSDMQRVYRLLKEAREESIIPWHWIVDEAREFERAASWDGPEQFARAASRQYLLDFWNQQPVRWEVWYEKCPVTPVSAMTTFNTSWSVLRPKPNGPSERQTGRRLGRRRRRIACASLAMRCPATNWTAPIRRISMHRRW